MYRLFTIHISTELSRKQLSQMYFKGELEKEIRHLNYPDRMKWVLKTDEDTDVMMETIVEEQSNILYEHQQMPGCYDRGMCVAVIIIMNVEQMNVE